MNIALGAVIIFILLTPPIAFYFSYTFGKFAKAGPKFTLLDGILASSIVALFVHAFAVMLIGGNIRFDILLKLLGGELKDLESKVSNADFSKAIKQFALYNSAVFLLAIALGRVARYAVQRTAVHADNELLRQKNKWWYLFRGYYLKEIGSVKLAFDMLYLDLVVDTRDGMVIYSGYLVDFVCEGEELKRIYLDDTSRRVFITGNTETATQPGKPVSIPGDLFCINYEEVKNMNLRFVEFGNVAEVTESPANQTST